MLAETIYSSMVNMVNCAIPSAFITLDETERVVNFRLSNRQMKSDQLIGIPFLRIIAILFRKQNIDVLQSALADCRKYTKSVSIRKLAFFNAVGEREYFRWSFAPVADTGYMVVFIQNLTEGVLIEDEFNALCEQQDSMNRELCIAMSKLDFQFMDLEQAHKKLAALYRITSVVQRTISLPEIFDEIISGLTQQLGYVNAAIFLLDNDTGILSIEAHQGYIDGVHVPISQGVIGYAARTRELTYIPDITEDSRYIPGTSNGVSEIAVPLIVDDAVIGVLDVEVPEGRIVKDYDLDLLRSLGSQIALTIAHAKHVANVQVQAITDSLTNLFNYRYFRTAVEQEFKRAVRYERPLAMLMVDIDNYKHYNDTNGHRMGDEVLRKVADILKLSVRDVDIVSRYGGEEFAILCPETFVDEAKIIAERIRYNIERYPFPQKETQPGGALTVSIGVSEYPRDSEYVDALVDHADIALYSAKRLTKNCVRVYGNP